MEPERKAAVDRIAAEIARVEFERPDGFDEILFHPLGVDGGSRDPFQGRRDRMLVISPFLTAGMLKRVASPDAVLVSSQDELDGLDADVLGEFETVKVLSDLAFPESGAEEEEAAINGAGGAAWERDRLADSAGGALRGLHAKLYVADAGRHSTVWVGSANATSAAFTSNVEFLVELIGKRRRCGINAILGDDKTGLAGLLQPYVRDPDHSPDEDQLKAERLVDGVAHALGSARLELTASAQAAENDEVRYELGLACPDGLPQDAPETVSIEVWPITLSRDRAVPLQPSCDCRWAPLEAGQLSRFLGCRIQAKVGSATVERDITLLATLRGAPDDRDAAVVRSVIGSAEQLLRYLMFLLSDPDTDAAASPELIDALTGETHRTNGDEPAYEFEFPLFESLVTALARDPSRLERVNRLIDDLSATDAGRKLLPEELIEVWEPIREAWRALEASA